jgi:hypothetical protein
MALTTSIAVGLVGLGPSRTHARTTYVVEPGPADADALAVEIDPEMLQGEAHRGWVQERAHAVLERRAEALEPGDRIVVELAGTSRAYRVEIRVLRAGEPLAEQPEPFQCNGSSDELLAMVETAVDDAVDRLVAARQAEVDAEAAREREAEAAAARERETKAEAERKRQALAAKPYRPAPLGLAGAVAIGLGGVMVVGGAILTARGEIPSSNDLLGPTDFRPPGYALLGMGSAVLATGVALLVVDVVRCKKDRVACGERGLRRAARSAQGIAVRW